MPPRISDSSKKDTGSSGTADNPFRPPASLNESFTGFVCSIPVGAGESQMLVIKSSIWTGIRSYCIGPTGIKSAIRRGPGEFEIGTDQKHHINIEVDAVARVNIYVDGHLVRKNVLAQTRRNAIMLACLLAVIGIVTAFLFAYLKIDRTIDDWIESRL